jgi:predicted nucleic acid-binding protein
MLIERVYIDTSVIGGCIDQEFKEWSITLFNEFKNGNKIAVISDITLDELELAPKKVQEIIKLIPNKFLEIVESNHESEQLAKQYINKGAVSEKFYLDALHIAIATYYNVTVLSSWNFKHIVNLDRIRKYNSVNIEQGYKILEIRSPRDILIVEENEES